MAKTAAKTAARRATAKKIDPVLLKPPTKKLNARKRPISIRIPREPNAQNIPLKHAPPDFGFPSGPPTGFTNVEEGDVRGFPNAYKAESNARGFTRITQASQLEIGQKYVYTQYDGPTYDVTVEKMYVCSRVKIYDQEDQIRYGKKQVTEHPICIDVDAGADVGKTTLYSYDMQYEWDLFIKNEDIKPPNAEGGQRSSRKLKRRVMRKGTRKYVR